jgi:hypothetical protein
MAKPVERLVRTDYFLSALTDEGFETVIADAFEDYHFSTKKWRTEHLYVCAHKDGLLLVCQTKDGNMNSSYLYYNWKPNSYSYTDDLPQHISQEEIWDGRHKPVPVVSGIYRFPYRVVHTIRRLREYGSFVNPWTKPLPVMLSHRMDGVTVSDNSLSTAFHDAYELGKEREKRLPDWVESMISGGS